ncbi:MAG: phosphatase PAP2 family protein [Rubrivivax sp.]|nr:phosphatase PAP2 family protein [Rubrivivax sp.]
MLFELALDIAKLGFFVGCSYAVLNAYARRRRPHWTAHLTRRRLAVVGLLTLAMGSIKVIEDVVAKESGPVDEAVLWFVREQVPLALTGFFAVVTLSGSELFLIPIAVVAALLLLKAGRRSEAWLLSGSLAAATLVVWSMKALIGRARPSLWEAQWYLGSSFPSGHTLSTAAFSTAAALCVARIYPRAATAAMALAMLWTALVALSRLILGVHWPSDVLAAMCIGAFIPLLFSLAGDLRQPSAAGREPTSR